MRALLDAAYRRVRKVDSGLDARLHTQDLVEYAAVRAAARARGLLTPHPLAFRGRGVTVRGGRHLRAGHDVVVGDHVLLDCLSENGVCLGDSVTIDRFATLKATGVVRHLGTGITVGDRTAVGAFNVVLGQGGVTIGRDCLLGPNVVVVSEEHNYTERERPIRAQGETRDPVVIGDDVWIGAGAMVLSGSVIGRGAVVAAGAVVKGEVGEYSITAGIPARAVKQR